MPLRSRSRHIPFVFSSTLHLVWITWAPQSSLRDLPEEVRCCCTLSQQFEEALLRTFPSFYFGCFFMALCGSNRKDRTAGQGFPQMQHGHYWHKFQRWIVFGRRLLLKISILNPRVVSAVMWIIDLSTWCPKEQIKTSHPGWYLVNGILALGRAGELDGPFQWTQTILCS